ncbi:MAG: hypothetical protein H6Q90_3564 [Deltaproteobacteria bacterium]|nr:hypothetical protein [Deltaproteobacteria bacterium]
MAANLGLWLAVMLAATVVSAWNVRGLLAGRRTPARSIDLRAGLLGSIAVVAVMVGSGVVRGQLEHLYPSGLRVMAFWGLGCDVAVGAMLITCWLRSDACRRRRPLARSRKLRVG